MLIERETKGGYRVLRVNEDLGLESDLSPLKTEIDTLVAEGTTSIAVRFTPGSFLYSHNVGVLVQCLEAVHEHGGALALVAPNDDIRSAVALIGFDTMVTIVPSEEALGSE